MSTLDAIADAWFLKAIEIYPEAARGGMMQAGDRFLNPVASTLRESLAILVNELAGGMIDEQVTSAVDAIVRVRAVQDCTPEQALAFTGQLLDVIRDRQGEELFPQLEQRIDLLALSADRQYALCVNDIARVRSCELQRLRSMQPWMRQTL
jgi:hypothetical protein